MLKSIARKFSLTTPPPSISLFCSHFSNKRTNATDEPPTDTVFVLNNKDPDTPPKLFVVQPRLRPDALLQWKLSEALNLANSLEDQRDGHDFASKKQPNHLVVQNPAARGVHSHADTYFGQGTVENVTCHLRALESEDHLDAVFVNTVLTGVQQRNLEIAWGKPVLDRVGLIIEIFNAHAETREGKLQSELAALMHKKSRLVRVRGPGGRLAFGTSGEAEVVSARGRGSGGRGFMGGAGETELQLQRRRIQERRNHLLSLIEEVRRTRALHRSARKRRGGSDGRGLATVAVVGYTNAGKSTLVSALSETDLYSDDRLFATVDPRSRSVTLPSGRKALLSDTVGFISDLPIQLVEAFHATLEEVVEADLLVHVLDSSAPNLDEQRSAVLQVLQQIGVSEEKIQNMIEVWNKIDLLNKDTGVDETLDYDEYVSQGETEEDNTFLDGEGDGNYTQNQDEAYGEGEDEKMQDHDEVAGERWDKYTQGKDEVEMTSELSSEESLECVEGWQAEPSEEVEMLHSTTPCETKCGHHVKTSAVTGVGLQQLLNLIDEKLDVQTPLEKKSVGPFDRKWRPSYATDAEKAAEQQVLVTNAA